MCLLCHNNIDSLDWFVRFCIAEEKKREKEIDRNEKKLFSALHWVGLFQEKADKAQGQESSSQVELSRVKSSPGGERRTRASSQSEERVGQPRAFSRALVAEEEDE